MWKQIAIYGVGLIGGSIGLAIRQRQVAEQVIGIGRSRATLETALRCGAIDRGTTDIEAAVAEADLIVIATPVDQIVDHAHQVLAKAPIDAIVTDAGSTKRAIVEALDQPQRTERRFIGSHPMAGSERTGVEAADGNLLQGRWVIVTPTPQTPAESLDRLHRFWQALGARTCNQTPAEHDSLVARISHLPHVVASVLASATQPEHLKWAASGWSDSTRIAAGDPGLWVEILRQNSDQIDAALDRFGDQLETMRQAIRSRNWEQVAELLTEGKRRRDALGS